MTFRVPSLDAACERALGHGYQIVGYDASNPEWKEAFLHPKQALGIVVQLAEAAPEPARPPRSPAAGHALPAVHIHGLRLRAHAPDRADTQWRGVLGATRSTAPDGALIYRWDGSPMVIAVVIDPARDEGPMSIEIAGQRASALVGGECPPGMPFSLP